MSLLDKSVPVDFEGKIFHPGRLAAAEGGIDQWFQNVPNL